MAAAYEATGAEGTGVYLLKSSGLEVYARGVPERDIDRYLSCSGPENDPLLQHVVREHTAVHDRLLFAERAWKKQPLYEMAIAPAALRHYLVAPILCGGEVVGAVTCGRRVEQIFAVTDLLRANTLSAYLSARLAFAPDDGETLQTLASLTPRERGVAILVVKGCTNREIATNEELSADYVKKLVDRLCDKFNASNRTELAGKIAAAM